MLSSGVCAHPITQYRPYMSFRGTSPVYLGMDGRALLDGSSSDDSFHWTPAKIVLSIVLFLVAGLCEIGGGWFIWKAIRGGGSAEQQAWYKHRRTLGYIALGGLALVGYGFLPTLQPPPTFGRLYAVYGGFFIVLSYLWGWGIDKDRPDKGRSSIEPVQGFAGHRPCCFLLFLLE